MKRPHFLQNPDNAILDFSYSGLITLSAFCGCKEGLRLSNYIRPSFDENGEKQDLFQHFCNDFVKTYPKAVPYKFIVDPNGYYHYVNSEETSSIKIKKDIQEILDEILDLLKNFFVKESVKNLILYLAFSENDKSRAYKIKKFYNLNKHIFVELQKRNPKIKNLSHLVYLVSCFLARCFKDKFFAEYSDLSGCADYLDAKCFTKNFLDSHEKLLIGVPSDVYKTIHVKKHLLETDCTKTHNRKRLLMFSNDMKITQLDCDKLYSLGSDSKVVLNVIYYMHFCILKDLIGKCKLSKIPIHFDHSYLYVSKKFEGNIKEIFFESVRSIILEKNCFEYLLELNHISLDLHQDYLLAINNKKKTILDCINNKTFVMNSSLLT